MGERHTAMRALMSEGGRTPLLVERASQRLAAHWFRISPRLRGYAISILCSFAALSATRLLRNPIFPTPLLFAAISISTWYGGGIAGVLNVVISALALDYYFIPPEGSLSLDKALWPYLFEFAIPALLTCWFVQRRKIAERQAELARVSRMFTIGEMGVSIAHEVNQPLMAVVLNGDACMRWLAADPPNLEQARKTVTRIVEEGTRAGEIVQRIRNLAKKTTSQKSLLNLNELAREVVSLLDWELSRNQIILRTDLHEDLPVIRGDRIQLQQVILNLAMNAIEAMHGETRRPRELCIRTERQASGRAVVTIKDSGPGLPVGDPERLFTAFYTTKQEGLGIGLSISRTIVEAHGGRLWASNSGTGAVFQFELPLVMRS